jgi:hypothetical protein
MTKLTDKDFLILQNSLKYLNFSEEESLELKHAEDITNKFLLWLEDVDVILVGEQKKMLKQIKLKSGEYNTINNYKYESNSHVKNINRISFNNISDGGKKRRKTFAEDKDKIVAHPIIKLENGETKEIKKETTEDIEMIEFYPNAGNDEKNSVVDELIFDLSLVDQSLEQSRQLMKNKNTFFDIEEEPSREDENKNTSIQPQPNEKIETVNVENEIQKINDDKLFTNTYVINTNSSLFSPKLSLIEVNEVNNNSSLNFDDLNSSKIKPVVEIKSNEYIKSNLLKDAQKILYENDEENSIIDESPLVVKWNPYNADNRIEENKFQTPNFSFNIFNNSEKKEKFKNKVVSTISENKLVTNNKENNNILQPTGESLLNKQLRFLAIINKTHQVQPAQQMPFSQTSENKFNIPVVPSNFIKPPSKNENDIKNIPYEITDESENSSSDEDAYKSYKSKKQIPSWANDVNYLNTKILTQRQINHKEIFGNCKINNLNLNILFSGRKEFDSFRGESADWKENTLQAIKCDEVNDTKRKIDFNVL